VGIAFRHVFFVADIIYWYNIPICASQLSSGYFRRFHGIFTNWFSSPGGAVGPVCACPFVLPVTFNLLPFAEIFDMLVYLDTI